MSRKWIILSVIVGVILVLVGAFITYIQGTSEYGFWVIFMGGLVVGVMAIVDILIHDAKWDKEIQRIKRGK